MVFDTTMCKSITYKTTPVNVVLKDPISIYGSTLIEGRQLSNQRKKQQFSSLNRITIMGR